ncbi:MAG TPA: class I SAM-dependent methyltransferase [Gaiellaceae bacterium]|nr:class I SAM-dependent methyltransferase [Gaiellaceae bacterium]
MSAPGSHRPFRGAAWFYAEYRYRPAREFCRLLAQRLGWGPSTTVLDLGAGPAHVSLPLAELVGEVVVMDPEPDMLAEGRRRAGAAQVGNLTFVAGGSDDLDGLRARGKTFAGVVISQAFHRMGDQDAVLRRLDPLLGERGAVALVGYVKEPDYNRIWVDREPWSVVEEIRGRYVPGAPGPEHDPFPEILARSAFSEVELLTLERDLVVCPSAEAALGYEYSLGGVLAALGDRRAAFEAEVREALAGADTSPHTARLVDSALIGRRG